MKLKRILSVVLTIAMLMSMLTSMSIVSAQEETPTGDAEFDIFKAAGVYYDLSADSTHTGKGTGMYIEVAGNPKFYNVGTEEGLAAFKADPQYASLGSKVETSIANKNAKYASYTDKDQAYNFTEYAGKPALFGINNVATQFVGNWKECLGEPNLYWMTTSDHFSPTDARATFVIQYYDNTGSFNFCYAVQGGANTEFTIKKGGTNKWVTKAFHVTNARLNKNLTGTSLIHGSHTGRFEFKSETYISKFAILKTSDYQKIMAGYDLDFENDTFCQFKRNSELIGLESFNYFDKVGMEISSAGISGLSESYADRTKGSDAYIVADPAGVENNPVLKVEHNRQVSQTDQITNTITKEIGAGVDEDSEYIIMSHRFWRSSGSYVRFFPNFQFKKYSDGSTWTGRALSVMHNGTELYQEGGAKSTINLNNFANKWVEYDFVINVHELTVDLYVDHQFAMTFDCTTGSNNIHPPRDQYYVSGISKYETWFDRQSATGTFYLDDIQIRQVNAEQAANIDDYMAIIPGEVNNGTVLPATTPLTKKAITWSVVTEDTGVSIENNVATVPANFDGDVTYKATLADGSEKTYAIGTCGYRTNIFKDTLDNLIYYKDKNIYNYPIPNYNIKYGSGAGTDQLAQDLIHKVTTVAQNPDGEQGDLVLKRIQTHNARATANTQRVMSTGDLNADYILYSVKQKIPSAYFRANLYLYYKDANGNISSEGSAGMRIIVKGDSLTNEMGGDYEPSNKLPDKRIEQIKFTSGKYSNKWVEFKVLIDTKNNNARVYYDDEYMYTHTIVKNSSAVVPDGVNVCGVSHVDFQPDWSAGSVTAYYDDVSVSAMTTADAVMYDLKTLGVPENVKAGTVLPTVVPVTGKAITWTTDNANVTVAADGTISCPSAFDGNVTFTAKVSDGVNVSNSYAVNVGLDPVYVSYTFGKRADTSVGGLLALASEGYNLFTNNGYKINNTAVACTGSYVIETGPHGTGDQGAPRVMVSNASGTDTRAAMYSNSFYRSNKTQVRTFQIYFDTNESISNDYDDLYMEVDYLDNAKGSGINVGFGLASTGEHQDGRYKIICDGTGEWKTAVIHITDAKANVNKLVSGKHDFRLSSAENVHGCYISGIRIYSATAANIDGEGNVSVKPEVKAAAEAANTKSLTVNRGDITNTFGKISADKLITPTFTGKVRLYAVIYDHTGDLKDVAVSDYVNVTEGVPVEIETAFTTKTFDIYNDQLACFFWDEDLKPVQ